MEVLTVLEAEAAVDETFSLALTAAAALTLGAAEVLATEVLATDMLAA